MLNMSFYSYPLSREICFTRVAHPENMRLENLLLNSNWDEPSATAAMN